MKLYLAILTSLILTMGCNKDSSSPTDSGSSSVTVTDADLFQLVSHRSGFIPYKNSSDTLLRATTSGHTEPKLRTLYNSKAATQLDAQGKVKTSPEFPDSSLIVKELINSDGTLSRTAVLFKLRTAANKDSNGWLWAEYSPTGTALYTVDNKGAGCISCHSSGVDYTLMNDAHP